MQAIIWSVIQIPPPIKDLNPETHLNKEIKNKIDFIKHHTILPGYSIMLIVLI